MRNSFLLSLATLTVVFGGWSASAETLDVANDSLASAAINPVDDTQTLNYSVNEAEWESASAQVQEFNPNTVEPKAVDRATEAIPGKFVTAASALSEQTAEDQIAAIETATAEPKLTTNLLNAQSGEKVVPMLAQTETAPGTTTPDTTTPGTTTPDTTTPGTTTTPDTTAPVETAPPPTTTPDTRQQELQVTPGRATRSGSSYIGIGGNIGIGDGDTALGEGSFAVLSKVGLTRVISARPSILISDDPTLLLPLTYDFVPRAITPVPTRFPIAPYIGGGAAISLGDDSAIDLLLTGGVDVPLSPQFTATASLNVTLFDNPAVGLLLGVGYNFRSF